MASDSFHAFVRELFEGLGPVTIKKFFGGGGVYADGAMFALLASDTIYLKADDALKRDLAEAGSGPFIWTPSSGPKAGQQVEMSYWRLPDAALDDPDEAVCWARRALEVARRAPAKGKAKQRRAAK